MEVKTLLDGFLYQVKNYPWSTAVVYEENEQIELTYGELAKRAASVAKCLIKAGMKRNSKVAVSVKRSENMIAAVLGVLWAGGAYVPVNYMQPVERRKSIYTQADIHYCITFQGSLAEGIEECTNLYIDEIVNDMTEMIAPQECNEEDTAYVIFTSGSTGQPKGVEISHGAALNTIEDVIRRFEITKNDCGIGISSLDFDLSVFDIFGLFSVGGKLIVLPEELHKEPQYFVECIRKYKVTIWNSVPALFEMCLLAVKESSEIDSLTKVFVSGDWVRPELCKMLRKHNKACKFIALGGATEASIWSNYFEVMEIEEEWTSIPYGKPLTNQKFRIVVDGMDAKTREVGELYIGGLGLAKGYVGAPELTDKAFIEENGERWYKTGDLGYFLPDGNMIFAGRMDNQIKLNGYRIELGEIEKNFDELSYANQAVALVKKDVSKNSLVAAIELKPEKSAIENLQEYKGIFNKDDSSMQVIVRQFIQKVREDKNAEYSEAGRNIEKVWDKYLPELYDADTFFTEEELIFQKELYKKVSKFRDILTGKESYLSILEDDLLSPTKLMADGKLDKVLDEYASAIRESIKAAKTEKLTVALLMGKGGEVFEKLVSKLEDVNEKIDYLYLDSSKSLLQAVSDKLSKYNLKIRYICAGNENMPIELVGIADVAIAINSIHAMKHISYGLLWIKMLIKKNGFLYAAEYESLSSIGLISAAVIEEGFTQYEDERKYLMNPMLPAEFFREKLKRIGFVKRNESRKAEGLYSVIVQNETGIFVETKQKMQEFCERKLVSYMIPEQICYTAKLPLNSNGKVDRNRIVKWFGSEDKQGGKPVGSGTEKKLAEIWSELLKREIKYSDENFFAIGGDSLIAARLITAVRGNFGITISMKELFYAQTLANLAVLVEERSCEADLEEGEL